MFTCIVFLRLEWIDDSLKRCVTANAGTACSQKDELVQYTIQALKDYLRMACTSNGEV